MLDALWARHGAVGFALLAIVAGCMGVPVTPTAGEGFSGEDPGRSTGAPPASDPAAQLAPAGLRRLTRTQYTNAIRDLLGADIVVPTDLETDTTLSGFAQIGAALTPYSGRAIERLESAALSIAQQAFSDPDRRQRLVPCAPSGAIDEDCARQFITSFGRRAWRRPLSDEEVGRYVALVGKAGEALDDFWKSLSLGLSALLESPNFLYRVEIGTAGAVAGVRTFDGWELATRLSFLLWDTTPDETLLKAAEGGALVKAGGLRREAERLWASPRQRAASRNFFLEMLGLAGLDDLEQKEMDFPQLTRTLGAALREETLRTIEDVVFGQGGDFRKALDLPETFVNPELARFYGLPVPPAGEFVRTPLPADRPRIGLFGQAAFLALNAHELATSPTRRGKAVREIFLCQPVPQPPPGVDTSVPPDPPGTPRTMREKLSGHAVPGCAACHSLVDPIGLAFENFDALGRYRTTEAGRDIDASGELDGEKFDDARGLAALLRKHPGVDACLTRSVYRYATGHVETEGEEVLVKRIATQLDGATDKWKALFLGVIESDGFRLAGENQ